MNPNFLTPGNKELIEYLKSLGFKDSQYSDQNVPESFIYHYPNPNNFEEPLMEVKYHGYYKEYYIGYLVKVLEEGETLRIATHIDGVYTPQKCKELVERHKHLIFKDENSVNTDYLEAMQGSFKHD